MAKVTSTDKLYGLVMAGGKSSRMKSDKGLIDYYGMPQREQAYKLLGEVCDRVFYSIRTDQKGEFSSEENIIEDQNIHVGPLNGILSAHDYDKNAAWFILACDLPLMNINALKQLKENRDPNKLVTAFATEERSIPEPLCAIWESDGLKAVLNFVSEKGTYSPVKFLLNSDIKIVNPLQEDVLLNANSEEDRIKVMQKLAGFERK
ncbi:NTP transferase domain-containing protein [Joostella atrarenae]|nr:NTP transferase domain-containing protein [Joostella atrarenae]